MTIDFLALIFRHLVDFWKEIALSGLIDFWGKISNTSRAFFVSYHGNTCFICCLIAELVSKPERKQIEAHPEYHLELKKIYSIHMNPLPFYSTGVKVKLIQPTRVMK